MSTLWTVYILLIFHLTQTLSLAHVHSAILRLPPVERGRADPMLPPKIPRLHPGLVLLHYPDDLLFRKPALLDSRRSAPDFSGRTAPLLPRERLDHMVLATTILDDPGKAPAGELAALYHERWEIETASDELKTHLRGAQILLRSKKTGDLMPLLAT